jgi:hypothetical protein
MFGAGKQLTQFSKHKTIQNYISEGYFIEYQENIANYIESSSLDLNYESPTLILGVLKIAIGFALLKNIQFKFIEPLIDKYIISNNKADINEVVWQYYPTTNEEKLFETNKFEHEVWFPNHQIYLYNIDKNLYCYVELFGVVQKYIHLSSEYTDGMVREKYLQRTIKWEFNENAYIAKDCKDLFILADQFDISLNVDGDLKKLQEMILHRAKSRSYEISSDSQIKTVQDLFERTFIYNITDIKGFKCVDKLVQKAEKAKQEFGFSLIEDIRNDLLDKTCELLHKDFNSFRIGNNEHDCAIKAKQVSEPEKRKFYSYRAYELLASINFPKKISFNIL